MANRTYKASLRHGGKASPGSKRISTTLHDDDFKELRALADKRHQTIGGTAADLIRLALKVSTEDENG